MSALPQHPPVGTSTHPPPYIQGQSIYAEPPRLSNGSTTYEPYPPEPQPYHPDGQLPPPRPRTTAKSETTDTTTPEKPSRKRPRAAQHTSSSSPGTNPKLETKPDLPAVLVREKKQKACANCRRAKLKCIVEGGDGDCVRCKARKEKCVFYPRNHEEDWQQTVTQDVYAAISHLSTLSAAVHHLIFHLTQQAIIPSFVTPEGTPLEHYELPDRDLQVMQGWTADKNKEMEPSLDKRKRRTRADDGTGASMSRRDSGIPQGDMNPFGSDHGGGIALPGSQSSRWETSVGQPSTSSDPMCDHLASTSSGHPPISHLALDGQALSYEPLASSRSMGSSVPNPSPTSFKDITPGSLPLISPGLQPSPQRNISQHPLQLVHQPSDQAAYLASLASTSTRGMVPAGCFIGSKDTRADVITQEYVLKSDAVTLVNYSHKHLAPFLFGYGLELGRFPYLPDGPESITPLILSVHCLLASERLPQFFHYHSKLAAAVKTELMESPAGSWQTVSGTEKLVAEGALHYEDDELNPELGIGPEEIVATAVLSLWAAETTHKHDDFARVAFKWARGWIKVLADPMPRQTIAYSAGLVPEERIATPQEKARVWLLCYIADGIVSCMLDRHDEPTFDPTPYCLHLIPNLQLASGIEARDIVLTSHARLLHIYRDWLQKSSVIFVQYERGRIADEIQRLAASIDFQISSLKHSLHGFVPSQATSVREFDLFALFAKTTMYSKISQVGTLSNRQRVTAVAQTIDVGLEVLEKCAAWTGPEEITNLPQQYIKMIYVVAHTVTETVSSAASSITPTGCAVTPQEVYPLLEQLGQALSEGGLQPPHHVRRCAEGCLEMAQQLRKLC